MNYTRIVQEDDYLEHHGIKGQKWGIRRYQNADGTLTEAGKRHYDIKEAKIKARAEKAVARAQVKAAKLAAKTEKLAAKNLKKSTREQAKILKMEMKKMKKTAQYEKGRKFGEKFAESFGMKFGESIGSGFGNTISNWQKWNELNTARRMLKLRERAYDDDNIEALKALGGKKESK